MKKNLILILVILITLILIGLFFYLSRTGKIAPLAQAVQATLSLSPNQGTYNIGDSFDVNINLDTGGQDTFGVDVELFYDPDKLEVKDADSSGGIQIQGKSLYPWENDNKVNPNAGTIDYRASCRPQDKNCFNGSGTLATISFIAKASSKPTEVNFNFTAGERDDSNVVYIEATGGTSDLLNSVINGSYTIIAPTPPPKDPTVNIKANGKDGPILVDYKAKVTLTWSSANASSCKASGSWSGSKPTSGKVTTGELIYSYYIFRLTCYGNGKSVYDSVRVNVKQPSPAPPQPQPPPEEPPPAPMPEEPIETPPDESYLEPSQPTIPAGPTETPTEPPKPPTAGPTTPSTPPAKPPTTTTVKPSPTMKPWIVWVFYVIIPTIATGALIYFYIRKRNVFSQEESV